MAEQNDRLADTKIALAMDHMREALRLLDAAKADMAASHLQMALDVTASIPPMEPGDELPDDDPIATDAALVRAMGCSPPCWPARGSRPLTKSSIPVNVASAAV